MNKPAVAAKPKKKAKRVVTEFSDLPGPYLLRSTAPPFGLALRLEQLRRTLTTGKRTIAVSSIRHLGPGVAIADGPYEIGERKMWTCFVVVKSGGEWKIAAIRNMLPARQP